MSRACLFLDRDGVINEKPPDGRYIRRWDEFRILPSAPEWIRLCNALDHLVIVVTNQRGVSAGAIRPEDLETIHHNMVRELAAAGARVDDVFCCPHAEDSCDCRKPRPGMIRNAQRKWDIDLGRSLLIGDSGSDAELARRCGLRFLMARNGRLAPDCAFARPAI